jgi:hypothetical protein
MMRVPFMSVRSSRFDLVAVNLSRFVGLVCSCTVTHYPARLAKLDVTFLPFAFVTHF